MIEVSTTEWESLRDACESLDDPRTPINIFHSVENIVAISLAAIIAGAEGPKSMARWAKDKRDWLATWLDLPDVGRQRRKAKRGHATLLGSWIC